MVGNPCWPFISQALNVLKVRKIPLGEGMLGAAAAIALLSPSLVLAHTLTSTRVFSRTLACSCSCMPRGRQLQPGVFDLVSIPPPRTVMFVGIILAICYMWGFMLGLVCLGYFNWIVAFTSVFAIV